MGVAYGRGSITVAPRRRWMPDKEYKIMRDAALRENSSGGDRSVDTGGSKIQFAIEADDRAGWS